MITGESTVRCDWQNKSIAAKRESVNHLQGVLGSWQPGAPMEEVQGHLPALNEQKAPKVCRANEGRLATYAFESMRVRERAYMEYDKYNITAV